MSESDLHIRVRVLEQQLAELKAAQLAMEKRLIAVEQSLQGRWASVTS